MSVYTGWRATSRGGPRISWPMECRRSVWYRTATIWLARIVTGRQKASRRPRHCSWRRRGGGAVRQRASAPVVGRHCSLAHACPLNSWLPDQPGLRCLQCGGTSLGMAVRSRLVPHAIFVFCPALRLRLIVLSIMNRAPPCRRPSSKTCWHCAADARSSWLARTQRCQKRPAQAARPEFTAGNILRQGRELRTFDTGARGAVVAGWTTLQANAVRGEGT